jgi:hypothetical protein
MLPYQSMPFGMVHYPIYSLLPERRPALCCATPRLCCRVSAIPSLEFILQLQFFSQYIWNGKCEPRVSYCPNAPNTLVVSSPSTPCRCESPGYAPPAGSGQQACRTLLSPYISSLTNNHSCRKRPQWVWILRNQCQWRRKYLQGQVQPWVSILSLITC